MVMRFERISEKVRHRVTSYMYRHTFATRALSAGESDTVVAGILGHANTAMIHKHYSHISEQGRRLKEAVEPTKGVRMWPWTDLIYWQLYSALRSRLSVSDRQGLSGGSQEASSDEQPGSGD
jgi:hypothetical protein